VHDDAGRLVDDQQMLVLIGDRERRGGHLGLRLRRRLAHDHALPDRHGVPLRHRRAVDEDEAGVDQPLRRRARPGHGSEEDVEPRARLLRFDDELHAAAAPRGRRAGPGRRT
jgi:hypothetical protein